MKRLSSDKIALIYNENANFYDFFTGIIEFLGLSFLRKKLLKNARGNVLEIGIGTGRNLKYYAKNCKITGVDYSEGMLEMAREKTKRLGMELNLLKMNAEKMNFKGRKFDTAVDTLGLCTYPNPVKVLKNMKSAVKKSGIILLLEHGISNRKFIRKMQERKEKKHYKKLGCTLLRNHEELVKKAGLRIVNIERKFFGIFYLIIAKVKF